MKLILEKGALSQKTTLFIQDSTSTTGAGKTGLAHTDMTIYYYRDTDTSGTPVGLQDGTLGTWSDGGFKEIDASNMAGFYQFCLPNSALASGAVNVAFNIAAAGAAQLPMEVQLTEEKLGRLSSDGLRSVDDSVPSGVGSDFQEKVTALWNSKFAKQALTSDELTIYNHENDDAILVQNTSDTGSEQILTSASGV